MARKYMSPLTKDLTPENWLEQIDLQKLNLDELIDIYGDMKVMEKMSKAITGFLKEAIVARMPEDDYESVNFAMTRIERERTSLDSTRVKEEMGMTWYEEHCKSTSYIELRIAKLED